MITKIFCSKKTRGQQIAGITADADGLLLTYCESVVTSPSDPKGVKSPQDGMHYLPNGSEQERRAPIDEVLEIDLWCAACTTGHPVDVGALFKAAQRRKKAVTLTSRGAWEGLWKPKEGYW